jgi:hypothetical protein
MRIFSLSLLPIAALVMIGTLALPKPALASAPGCGQAQVEKLLGAAPPPGPSQSYIYPRQGVTPYYQWESNNGYCGETSLISSGMVNGQWMSQYSARLICGAFAGLATNGSGASLLQAGNPLRKVPNYNAQLLIEAPDTEVSGPDDFAYSALCGANSQLQTAAYPYTTGFQHPNLGLAGYQDYMRWIKAQVIAGNQVTIAVDLNGGSDAQYDHEVSVLKIGTNHSPSDDTYYGDDVVYFEDHGVYTLKYTNGKWRFAENPSIPLGAGDDTEGCTPYIFAYTFDSLPHTRAGANASGASAYSIVLPGDIEIDTGSGNTAANGNGQAAISGPHNYAFSVSGPIDPQGVTKPILLKILRTESLVNGQWQPNPWDANSVPAAGNNYENPYIGGPIGSCNLGQCVRNTQPAAMLMSLQATVSGLTPGTTYNLYEYDFPTLSGADTGTAAALKVPTQNFNANAGMASSVTRFTATGSSYLSAPIQMSSAQIVVFRAVAASAP